MQANPHKYLLAGHVTPREQSGTERQTKGKETYTKPYTKALKSFNINNKHDML